jgi:hypothetical protein
VLSKLLADKKKLLFIMSLLIAAGGWLMSIGADWHIAFTPSSIGGLFILLGNNVFANMIKNIGLLGAGVTDESAPKNPDPK